MPRQNRQNPRQGTTNALASSIKKAAKQTQSKDIRNTIKILSNQQRLPEIRDGTIVNLGTMRKFEAAYVQLYGLVSREQCTKCQGGKGPFQECIFAESGEEKEIMGGSCANCYYENGYKDSQCTLRKPSQTPIGKDTKRLTAPRSYCLESKDESRLSATQLFCNLSPNLQGESVSPRQFIPSLNQQSEESYGLHLTASAILPDRADRDILMLLELELPKLGGDQVTKESLKLFTQERKELAKLRARSMERIKKPINSLQEAFVTFETQENNLGVKFLVRPSGSLQSPVAHYLNQPSFSTASGRLENGETADPFNPGTRIVMENAFEPRKTVMFDHLHHRSQSCEDIENTQSQISTRHESFTANILESLEAKVIIVYGVKVQKRLLESRVFTFLPLWDEYDVVLVALDRECTYREPDEKYKFRRAFLFAKHPNHLMYQQKGNEVLIRQDVITKAAATMAGVGYLVKPNFYRDKLWSRDDPQRSAALMEVRDLAQQLGPQPLRETILSPSIAFTFNEADPIVWSNLWDDQSTYSNNVLAEEILPAALAFWRNTVGDEQQLNWRSPSDLPLPVLKWLLGSRYALFNSAFVPESDNEITKAIHGLAFETQPTAQFPLEQALRKLVENQDALVKKVHNVSTNLVHCGVGQVLVVRCNTCGSRGEDSNPLWAVKRPGHYCLRAQKCHSSDCARITTLFPEVLDILRTPDDGATLEKEGFNEQYALRSCLRTQNECSDLPNAVESWCMRCKEQTSIHGDRTYWIDHNPRWTLGRKPLYVERRPRCLSCQHAGHSPSRIVPFKLEIASVMPRLVANRIVDLERDIKNIVIGSTLQASVRS